MKTINGFYAYPSNPSEIGETIEVAKVEVQRSQNGVSVTTWKTLDIVGHFISEEVLQKIDANDFLIADISRLNFNVTYEIGYAIGKGKRILLTKNKSLNSGTPTIQEVGIFDTIGYKEYQNSSELVSYIKSINSILPINISHIINTKSPVYLLATKYKTDWATRIVSRIKKSKYIFRSFDPNELPRLSAYDAISQVSQSYGIVVPLLSSNTESYQIHNLRGAFIAGLADGMEKALCIIQHGDEPVPIDYRDFVKISYHPNDVDELIAEFASEVAAFFQQEDITEKSTKESFLQNMNLGSTSAENEMKDLANYYLKTDQYLKSLRGEAHLIVGRKGSGKSAIFFAN